MNEQTEYMPLPTSSAVTANEIDIGTYRFRITDHEYESRSGTYPLFNTYARPIDVDLDPAKSMKVSFAWNPKKNTGCGDFIRKQGAEVEITKQGVRVLGLKGTCFEAEVIHVLGEKTDMLYANIDRDTVTPVECSEQDRLANEYNRSAST